MAARYVRLDGELFERDGKLIFLGTDETGQMYPEVELEQLLKAKLPETHYQTISVVITVV